MQAVVDVTFQLDRLEQATRRIRVRGTERYGNPAEHSSPIALLALSLAPCAAKPVDADHVVRRLLAHGVGKIDVGRAFSFAERDAAGVRGRAVRDADADLRPPARRAGAARTARRVRARRAGQTAAHAAVRAIPFAHLANASRSRHDNGISRAHGIGRLAEPICAGRPALSEQHLEGRRDETRRKVWLDA